MSLFRLYSGHTNTRDHWIRLKRDVESPECRRCKSHPESAKHLLLECPALWSDQTLLDQLNQAMMSECKKVLDYPEMLKYRSGEVFDAIVGIVSWLVKCGVHL